MINLEIFRKAFRIDESIPFRRGRFCDFFTTVNGGTVSIYRYWHHDLFKHGKPKRLRKNKT